MFPRHLKNVGCRCLARGGCSRFSYMSRDYHRCPWWTAYYPQTFYQPTINSWHRQEHWRPYPCVNHLRPALLSSRPRPWNHGQLSWPPFFNSPPTPWMPGQSSWPPFLNSPPTSWMPGQSSWPPFLSSPPTPWNPGQSSWIHMSHHNMDSKGEEPFRKRRKSADDDDREQIPWSKRSYPPASDFRVPPARDASGLSVPSGWQPEVKATATEKRKWENFSHLYCEQSIGWQADETFDFSVMSYNILSQDLLEDNSSLYSHCRRPYLFWHYRLPNILRELELMNADILCLQEVQEDHYEREIKPRLEALGYCCEYKARTGSKPDGCAICFKSEKFRLLLVKPVEYYRKDISLLDRDNIGLVLTLQPKTAKEAPTLCVANTHLLFNPRRGDIKLTQLAILLAEITKVAQLQDERLCPIILCGDFNSVPGSPLHRFIKEGRLNYGGMTIGKVSGQERYTRGQRILSIPIWPKSLGITQQCVYEPNEEHKKKDDRLKKKAIKETNEQKQEFNEREDSNLQHHFCLSSVYSHYTPDTGVPEITTCHSKQAVTVDYIFYSPAKSDHFSQRGASAPCAGLQLLGRLSLLTEQDLWSVNGLPNESNSSDHLSLLARFRLAV